MKRKWLQIETWLTSLYLQLTTPKSDLKMTFMMSTKIDKLFFPQSDIALINLIIFLKRTLKRKLWTFLMENDGIVFSCLSQSDSENFGKINIFVVSLGSYRKRNVVFFTRKIFSLKDTPWVAIRFFPHHYLQIIARCLNFANRWSEVGHRLIKNMWHKKIHHKKKHVNRLECYL